MFPPSNGPLQPPGSSNGPGPGGGFVSTDSATPDPNEQGKRIVAGELIPAVRRLGMMYPALMPEVREITQNLAPRMLQKLVASQPNPEPQAPPV